MFIFFIKSTNQALFYKNYNYTNLHQHKLIKQPTKNRLIILYFAFIFLKIQLLESLLFSKNTNFLKKVKSFKKLFLKKRFFLKKFLILGFLNRFLLTFFEFFFKKKILFFFKKKTKLKKFSFFFNYFKKIKPPFGVKLRRDELIHIIYFTLLIKDCEFLLNYLCKIFESSAVRTHKKFFLFLKKIFRKCRFFYKRLRVRGIFLDIKGKIGVTGNAKKRRLYFRCRRHSLTKKKLKLNLKRGIVKTSTGVLGITAYIFF